MKYRRLGGSGLEVSKLSFGSWVTFGNQVDEAAAEKLMTAAYDAGINFFDNAEAYAGGASEQIMGKVLTKLGWGRDTFCVSSKVYWGGELPTQRGLSRKHVVDACHAALARLQVDYLDLYFCHRPDLNTPIEETVRTMHDLITQGKVLYWGTSEWSAEQIRQAHAVARQWGLHAPTMEQPQYNMFARDRVEREYHRLYGEVGLGTTIWSPLASGVLTGKYDDGVPEGSRMDLEVYKWLREQTLETEEGLTKLDRSRKLAAVATDLGISRAQLALAWCLRNPNVSTVILGATKLKQLEENIAAADKVELLTDEVMARIDDILGNTPELPTRI